MRRHFLLYIIAFFSIVILIGLSSAFTVTTFNNSLTSENLNITPTSQFEFALAGNCVGDNVVNCPNAFDGDFATSAVIGEQFTTIYTNFSIPNGITNAFLTVKTGSVGIIGSQSGISCYNGTDFQYLGDYNDGFPILTTYTIPQRCLNGGLLRISGVLQTNQLGNGASRYFEANVTYQTNTIRYLAVPSSVSNILVARFNLTGVINGYKDVNISLVSGIKPIDYFKANIDLRNNFTSRNFNLSNQNCVFDSSIGILSGGFYCGVSNTNKLYVDTYNWSNTKNLTFSAWANINQSNVNSNYIMLAGDSNDLNMHYGASPPSFMCDAVEIKSINLTTGNILNNWHYYTLVQNDTDVVCYLDGVRVANESNGARPLVNGTVNFGTKDGIGRSLNGVINEIAFWNTTLNSSQVNSSYTSYLGSYPTNLTVRAGTTFIFNFTNPFSQVNNITSGFQRALNTYLSSCSYVSGICNIPFSFDSQGNSRVTYSDLLFDNTGIIENSQTYNNRTFVGASEQFIINVTYDSIFYPSAVAILTYNGTNYTGTQTSQGIFSRTITIPTINVPEQNNTFYWTLLLTNSSGTNYFASSQHNQTVNQILLDNCGTNTVKIYNFTVYDEDNLFKLNGTAYNTTVEVNIVLSSTNDGSIITNFTGNYSHINPAFVCIGTNTLNTTSYYADAIVRYDADNYVSEFYNEQRTLLNNGTIPRNIPLYDLLTTRSQEFKMTFKDASLLPLQNYVIQINRLYISDGTYRTVEAVKTDSDGITLGHFVLSEVYYRLVLTKDGNIVYTYPDFQAVCDNAAAGDCQVIKYIFTQAPVAMNFSLVHGVQFTPLRYNANTRVVSTNFTIVDGSSQLMILNVTDNQGNQLTSSSLTSSLGNLAVTLPQLDIRNGQANLSVIVILQNGNYELTRGHIDLTENAVTLFGASRGIMIVGIVLTMVFMALSSGGLMLVFFILGLLLSGGFGLLSLQSGNSDVSGIGGALTGLIIFVAIYLIKKGLEEKNN